jgi:CRP-like cAMP-binding protein
MKIQAALSSPSFFVSLDAEDLERLTGACTPYQIAAGETIFKEGDPGESLFVILSGKVDVHISSQDGEVVLSSLGPGDVLGEIAVLDGKSRTAAATAVEITEMVLIERAAFQDFLAERPQYMTALLTLLAERLRNTDTFFPDLGGLNVGASQQGGYEIASSYPVTLVGYGRYGSLHIGPKYAKEGYPWDVVAIVSPSLNRPRLEATVLGHRRPETRIFHSFDEWHAGYFKALAAEEQKRHVLEIALRPGLVYEETKRYIEAGVKQIILPKPVVMVEEELYLLTELVARHEVKAAVSSQWHYSDFPKIIGREIARMAGQRGARYPRLQKVEMEFSKENGAAISVTPPLSELPHVLQLLESVDLLDLAQERPQVRGDEMLVDVAYWPDHVPGGVHLRAGLDWQPDPQVKRRYPNWDVQERSLKVTFQDQPSGPGLEVDFWIKFARSGDLAIRPGMMKVRSDAGEMLAMQFVEDQLLHMNEKIYESFAQSFTEFQNDRRVLSLARYVAIGTQLMQIEAAWREAVQRR